MLTRFLLWRALAGAGALVGVLVLRWLLSGGPGRALRGAIPRRVPARADVARLHATLPAATGPVSGAGRMLGVARAHGVAGAQGAGWPHASVLAAAPTGALVLGCAALLLVTRLRARRRRRYVRLRVLPYRTDRTSPEGLAAMFQSLHQRVQCRGWRRILHGQPSLALEVHCAGATGGLDSDMPDGAADQPAQAWLAVVCPAGLEAMVEAALRNAYPNCSLAVTPETRLASPPAAVRLRKHASFIKRVKQLDRFELGREPPVDRLITVMGACRARAFVQLALTPTPALFEGHAKRAYKRHEAHLTRARREHPIMHDRSLVEEAELRGGLEVQHRPLFFADLRVAGPARETCERIASELRAEGAENRLVQRGGARRARARYLRRVARGEGNPWPSWRRATFASTELPALWHLPSVEYATVPFARSPLPLAPASPAIMRPRVGHGTLRDAHGPVCIHPEMRRLNTAVPGAVEQGKSSYLAATVAEDLRRERCAVIVLDPKGDAAEATLSLVPADRTCTLLDLSHPTCGFNPLAVAAPADTIADYVVGALKHLFTDADIRASSDRYLRNAIIAVLAHDSRASLWDAARLLSVGEEGYAYRSRVAAGLRTLPEFKEIAQFFTAELSAQLADSRSTTTAKLDAPVNKLARLLNSPSIKRVLLNDSLTIDLDNVISRHEVLVVKGALGATGAGNTAVLMQLLVGMLDAALARQQDRVPAEQRVAVALKVDEAPLVLNHGFAETLALKRSAGLETVACWQTDSQWIDREIRDQLDALFAHRVYFATASARDARNSASLMMADFADTVRPEIRGIPALGRPDARLHLPKHHAIVSWTTPHGRQPPFLARTLPLRVDAARLAHHAARQAARGGRYLADLSQPHWQRREGETGVVDMPAGVDRRADMFGEVPAKAVGGPVAPGGAVVSNGVSGAEDDGGGGTAVSSRVSGTGSDGGGGTAVSNGMSDDSDDAGGGATVDSEGVCGTTAPAVPAQPIGETQPPPVAADSFRELVELDAARRVRPGRSPDAPRALEAEPLDIEILALLCALDHVLTSQIHRRFNPTRTLTTTQRRLKRLADAGLVQRFQFHRPDGGGAPMCHTITPVGRELLAAHDRLELPIGDSVLAAATRALPPDRHLRQVRHNVHVAGWVLALERAVAGRARLRGPREAVLSVPLRSTPAGRVAIGPADLRLPGGRTPHDFLHTAPTGARVEVERFETVRPDASLQAGGIELLVELDDRLAIDDGPPPATRQRVEPSASEGRGVASPVAEGRGVELSASEGRGVASLAVEGQRIAFPMAEGQSVAPPVAERSGFALPAAARPDAGPRAVAPLAASALAKLERYDHLLAGWSLAAPRFARRGAPRPVVVFVCRHRARARECARRADRLLCACRAYPGEHPHDWQYPARTAILFAAERDIHEGLLLAYGVPPLPPAVRAAAGRGVEGVSRSEPGALSPASAAEPTAQLREIPIR